jgi:ferric-dicitrate binding protein FerR (iron transport regulator)
MKYWKSVVLAAAFGLVIGWFVKEVRNHEHRFATAAAEQLDIGLGGGSFVRLNARTAVTIHRIREHTRVVLENGEARFEFANSGKRSFEVNMGGATIRGAGAFNVRHRDGEAKVVIARRSVEIRTAPKTQQSKTDAMPDVLSFTITRAVMGEEVVIRADGELVKRPTPATELGRSWIEPPPAGAVARAQSLVET